MQYNLKLVAGLFLPLSRALSLEKGECFLPPVGAGDRVQHVPAKKSKARYVVGAEECNVFLPLKANWKCNGVVVKSYRKRPLS